MPSTQTRLSSPRQHENAIRQRAERRQLGLAYLIIGLAGVFCVAAATVGTPQVPTSWPRLPTMTELELLGRSPTRDQLAGVLGVLTWAVWLMWGYVLLATALRVLVIVAEHVLQGAAWVRSFRTLSNLLTVPALRRAVDASLAGTLFLRVAVGAGVQEFVVTPAMAQVQVDDARPGVQVQ